MKPNEVADKIKKLVKVSPQQVALAKAFLLAHIFRDPEHAIQQFLREMEAIAPEKIVLHQSVDLQPIIKQAAKAISWQLAACEAV